MGFSAVMYVPTLNEIESYWGAADACRSKTKAVQDNGPHRKFCTSEGERWSWHTDVWHRNSVSTAVKPFIMEYLQI